MMKVPLSVADLTNSVFELTGQVFIVTQGAENVKLGDVEVSLIEKSQVPEYLVKEQFAIESKIAARIAARQQELMGVDENVKNAQTNFDIAIANISSGNSANAEANHIWNKASKLSQMRNLMVHNPICTRANAEGKIEIGIIESKNKKMKSAGLLPFKTITFREISDTGKRLAELFHELQKFSI